MAYIVRRTVKAIRQAAKFMVAGVILGMPAVLAPAVAEAMRVPAVQKITVKLVGDCSDGVMDEADGDESCVLSLVVSPKTPVRTFTVQEAEPGAKKWSTLKKLKVTSGKLDVDIDYLDSDAYRDGTYSYRVTAPKVGKEKTFLSPTLKVQFTPAEVGDDIGDDLADGDASTAPTKTTTPKATTGATTTTVAHSTTGGGATATTTTIAAGTNGGTPTNTTAPGNEDVNWWGGVAPTVQNLGAFCDSNDPTMYVGATICSSSGIGGRKSVTQFKTLISSISNAAPQYKRNGFCMQAMFAFGHPLATQTSKCAEADAGR